jgi:hypothetical protein
VATTAINDAFMRIERRAERVEQATLVDTFVDVGPLFRLLQSNDHQVIYGRRGTGKTHALQYLVADRERAENIAVYTDMRSIGSTSGIYGDPTIDIAERGTRLLMDTLQAVHEQLVDVALEASYEGDGRDVLSLLDELADQITEVRVVGGDVERVTTIGEERGEKGRDDASIEVSTEGVGARLGTSESSSMQQRAEVVTREVGQLRHRVHFGAVSQTLGRIVDRLAPGKKLLIVLDEWSVVPLDLQPLLADLVRRALFPIPNVIVKIGAIEHRSRFRAEGGDGGYIGIELGADASADVNLDDFMVFNNDATKASHFFRELLFKHVRAMLAVEGREDEAPHRAEELIRRGFTQANAFGELVRAAEGVPRDALHIASYAAQGAMDRQISMDDVRSAARRWYQRDKEATLTDRSRALLNWIMDRVIGDRRARAFFLEQGQGRAHDQIGFLYDQRVLHVVKKGVATYVQPGVRYDVYGLDYGCYVDLMATQRAPQGMFQAEDKDGRLRYFDVPQDDYRSIRRAILDLSEFERETHKEIAVTDSVQMSDSVSVKATRGEE